MCYSSGMSKRIRARRAERRQWREAAAAFNKDQVPGGIATTDRYFVRRLSFEALVRLHNSSPDMVQRAVLIAEIERRKAWESPAGRAFWISIGAFIVAAVSLLLNFLR